MFLLFSNTLGSQKGFNNSYVMKLGKQQVARALSSWLQSNLVYAA